MPVNAVGWTDDEVALEEPILVAIEISRLLPVIIVADMLWPRDWAMVSVQLCMKLPYLEEERVE